MKWISCTPVAFEGDERFYGRDSGLFCRALNAVGECCHAVLPEPAWESDLKETRRVPYSKLESPQWWKNQGVDAVLLYAWGLPQYAPIVRAIKEAGLFLVEYLDHNGEMYPWLNWAGGTSLMYDDLRIHHGAIKGRVLFALKLLYAHFVKPFCFSLGQKKHLSYVDCLALPMPHTCQMFERMQWLYGPLKQKILQICCPVGRQFQLQAVERERGLVIAAGRWDDVFAKRPQVLLGVMRYCLAHDAAVRFLICGTILPEMESLAEQYSGRVELAGMLSQTEMPKLYARAQVSLCTSIAESTHIASAEALCCGCSVVAQAKYGTEPLQWYASEQSGTTQRVPLGGKIDIVLAKALLDELEAWKNNERDATQIAATWQERFYAENSARKIVAFAQKKIALSN